MQNAVPATTETASSPESVSQRVAERAVADRREVYASEVRRLLDAAFIVIERGGDVDAPVREIVRESGLSNQAFYRHFTSKDELLIALLQDGRRRLVGTLERRMAKADPGRPRVRAWIQAMLSQASDPAASARTRPFAIDGPRLANRFPVESRESFDLLVSPLRDALGEMDADVKALAPVVSSFTLAAMHDALITRRVLAPADIDYLTDFILRGAQL